MYASGIRFLPVARTPALICFLQSANVPCTAVVQIHTHKACQVPRKTMTTAVPHLTHIRTHDTILLYDIEKIFKSQFEYYRYII